MSIKTEDKPLRDMGGVRMTQQWNPRSIVSTLILLSIPTLLSNVLEGLNGFVNTLAVGRLLGKSALAATSSANLIMFFLFSVDIKHRD